MTEIARNYKVEIPPLKA